jgi:hypothetical protein
MTPAICRKQWRKDVAVQRICETALARIVSDYISGMTTVSKRTRDWSGMSPAYSATGQHDNGQINHDKYERAGPDQHRSQDSKRCGPLSRH